MVEEVRKIFVELLSKYNGLQCILVTDRDGVHLLKVASDKAPEHAMRPNFISTFGLAADQGSKLGAGNTNTIISKYSHYNVIQISKQPLIVTYIASESCNIGQILDIQKDIDPILSTLTLAVVES